MSLEELKTLIEAYGGDPARWPDDRRETAEALIERSPDAQQMVDEATALDRLLAAVPAVEASSSLLESVSAIPSQTRQEKRRPNGRARSWMSFGGLFPSLASAIAVLAVGFFVGTLNVVPVADPFSTGETEVVDLAEFVFGEDLPEGIEL